MSAQSVSELYRCRWNIEIVFRAWKQSANLDKALNRTSNEDHFQVLMLAAMIYQVLSLSVMVLVRNLAPGKKINLEKLFDDCRH
jgi:IS4 transposase